MPEVILNSTVGVKMIANLEEISIDKSANTSTVRLTVKIYSQRYFHCINPGRKFSYNVFGTTGTVYVNSIGPLNGSSQVILTRDVVIPHNSNGSIGRIPYSAEGVINTSLSGYWFGSGTVNGDIALTQWTTFNPSDAAQIARVKFGSKDLSYSDSYIPMGIGSITFEFTNMNFSKYNYKYAVWKQPYPGASSTWEWENLPYGKTFETYEIRDWSRFTVYSTDQFWFKLVTTNKNGDHLGEHEGVIKLTRPQPIETPRVAKLNLTSDNKLLVTTPPLEENIRYHISIDKLNFADRTGWVHEIPFQYEASNLGAKYEHQITLSSELKKTIKEELGTSDDERTLEVYLHYNIDGLTDVYNDPIATKYTIPEATVIIGSGTAIIKDVNPEIAYYTGNSSYIISGKSTIRCEIPANLFSSSEPTEARINRIVVQVGNITASANITSNTSSGGNASMNIDFGSNSTGLNTAPKTFTITAYNDKGKQTSKDFNCNVIEYFPPIINYKANRTGDHSFIVNRINDDNNKPRVAPVVINGAMKNAVMYAEMYFTINSSTNRNDIKGSFGSTYVDSAGRINLNPTVAVNNPTIIQRDSKVVVKLKLVDKFGGIAEQTINIASWTPIMHIDGNRSGVSVNDRYPDDIGPKKFFSKDGIATDGFVLAGKNRSFTDNYSRTKISEVYGNNFDSINFNNFRAGWYYWDESIINSPDGDKKGTCLITGVVNNATNMSWISILAFGTSGELYRRNKFNNNSWSKWTKLSAGGGNTGNFVTKSEFTPLVDRVVSIETLKPTMAWLHGNLNQVGAPPKEELRLSRLRAKTLTERIDFNDLKEEGVFFVTQSMLRDNNGFAWDNMTVINTYIGKDSDFLQQVFAWDASGMATRKYDSNNNSFTNSFWWLNTDNVINYTTKHADVSLQNGWVGYGRMGLKVVKTGKMVTLSGQIKRSWSNSSTVMGTIPDKYRPPENIWGNFNSGRGQIGLFKITSGGEISYDGYGDWQGGWLSIHFTYYCDQWGG